MKIFLDLIFHSDDDNDLYTIIDVKIAKKKKWKRKMS